MQCILESFLLSVSAGDQFRLQSIMIYTSYLPKKSKKLSLFVDIRISDSQVFTWENFTAAKSLV